MVNTLLSSKVIYERLSECEALQEVVESRIYPIIAEQGSKYPFIVFKREGVQSSVDNKDNFTQDSLDFSVTVISSGYLEGVEIANTVRQLFDGKKITNEDLNLTMDDITLSSAEEDFGDDAYEQVLTFSCNCYNK